MLRNATKDDLQDVYEADDILPRSVLAAMLDDPASRFIIVDDGKMRGHLIYQNLTIDGRDCCRINRLFTTSTYFDEVMAHLKQLASREPFPYLEIYIIESAAAMQQLLMQNGFVMEERHRSQPKYVRLRFHEKPASPEESSWHPRNRVGRFYPDS